MRGRVRGGESVGQRGVRGGQRGEARGRGER